MIYVEYINEKSKQDDGQLYGNWTEENKSTILNVHQSEGDVDYQTENIAIDGFTIDGLNAGDAVYVLSMIYTTGDSFGSSNGNCEILYAFKNKAAAYKAANIIENIGRDEYSLVFEDDHGLEIKMSNPSYDYFSSIEDVRVEEFIVK